MNSEISALQHDHEAYWTQLHREHAGSLDAVGYPELGRGFNEVTYAIRLRAAETILRRAHSAPENVLEGAVGVGAYGDLWKNLGVQRWVGLDLSLDTVERLRRRFPEQAFFQVDLTEGNGRLEETLRGEHFDLVTAVDVLYHLIDEWRFEQALIGLGSRVRPGGFLLLSDVFVHQPVRVADHVLRRPLTRYEAILGGLGFQLVDREPVFAMLGDPVPRGRFHAPDILLRTTWRVLSKAIRTAPGELRERVGRVLARALVPLDDLLKRSGTFQGTNLELALFHRADSQERRR